MHPCSEHIYRRRLAQFNITSTRRIGDNSPCFIVAEIGQNHQGDISIARRLIDLAANSQVDCVKFQKSCLPKRFTKEVLNQPYTSENSWGSTYGEHRNFLEFSKEDFLNLKLYAENRGLFFAATGMDEVSVDFLNSINVPLFKVGSADATNLPLLKHIARFQKPLFISTGMSTEYEVQKMYEMISKENNCIALLQCTSCYPTPIENVNLNVIKTYKDLFPGAVIGYSGHESGTAVSLAAVSTGAKILERHITLDHTLKGSDHKSSLNEPQLKCLVSEIRKIERAMGCHIKTLQNCEMPCKKKLGKP